MAYESFRQWQAKSIDQKQSASSLLLGLAAGALAFSVKLLSEAHSFVGCAASIAYQAALLLNAFSISAGLSFTLNRVRDFDLTAHIARQRERDPRYMGLKAMRSEVRRWGRMTKRLYECQVVSFWLGMIAFLIVVFLHYQGVLYAATDAG